MSRVLLRRADGAAPRLVVLFGTRPEAIKLFPVLAALQERVASRQVEVTVISTGQHRELSRQACALFGIAPEHDLDLMREGEPLDALHARLLQHLGPLLRDLRPDALLVQGDTLSAFSGGLSAFYQQVPVLHVEAGLRTWDPAQPFPEEIHRRFLATVASFHFCPTDRARQNLLDEGVSARDILVTGNTVIDAMRLAKDRVAAPTALPRPEGARLFVTVHRRENHALLERGILPAIRRVVDERLELDVVFSVHPHPAVRETVRRLLGRTERLHLVEPLPYPEALGLVRESTLVITDSGGLQEEATALGTPVLVLRRTTERFEAVDAGNALLVGTGVDEAAESILSVLDDDALRRRMAVPSGVFGDGHASERIVARLLGG